MLDRFCRRSGFSKDSSAHECFYRKRDPCGQSPESFRDVDRFARTINEHELSYEIDIPAEPYNSTEL
jgi:hypothetical protein